ASDAAQSVSHRRQRIVVVGLLLSILGWFLLVLLLPSSPGGLYRVLPVAAGGMSIVWIGGILMGFGMGRRSRSPPRGMT
ncbi:MAG: hypothetical protein WCA77_08380, partial [Thermoplasmata archaeon]